MTPTSLNFCSECDKPFQETEDNPGCICEDCRNKIKDENGEQYLPKTEEDDEN